VAYTPCFRREAGAHGKDTRGILRVHQFDKVELMRFERAEASRAALDELTGHAEAVLQRLGLRYRVLLLAGGDLGFANAQTYDLEVWAPGVQRWLEVSSCSLYNDYQARRANVRYRPALGARPEFAHTLNGSGTGLPRTLIGVLETYQQADGSIHLPPALAEYARMERITR
jgi:seryl-tRNA synthetase